MSKLIPKIESDRLILRAHELKDFAGSAAMWADPQTVTYIGGKTSTEQQSWSRFLNYAGHWAIMGFGYWAVEEKSTGQFVGEIGFADFKRDLKPSIQGIPEMGWALIASAQGKGFATEGVKAALKWASRHFGPVEIACMISPENTASIQVAKKCAFQERHKTDYQGSATTIYFQTLEKIERA